MTVVDKSVDPLADQPGHFDAAVAGNFFNALTLRSPRLDNSFVADEPRGVLGDSRCVTAVVSELVRVNLQCFVWTAFVDVLIGIVECVQCAFASILQSLVEAGPPVEHEVLSFVHHDGVVTFVREPLQRFQQSLRRILLPEPSLLFPAGRRLERQIGSLSQAATEGVKSFDGEFATGLASEVRGKGNVEAQQRHAPAAGHAPRLFHGQHGFARARRSLDCRARMFGEAVEQILLLFSEAQEFLVLLIELLCEPGGLS